MTAKLHFFAFIAGILKPFLVFKLATQFYHSCMMNSPKFQSIWFCWCTKEKKVDEAKTVSKAMKEDWLKNENNQMEFLIDIRAKAKDDFSKAKVDIEKKQIPWRVQVICCQSAAETSGTCSNSICFSEKFLFN